MKRKWPIIGCKPIPDYWLVEEGDGQGHPWEEAGDAGDARGDAGDAGEAEQGAGAGEGCC